MNVTSSGNSQSSPINPHSSHEPTPGHPLGGPDYMRIHPWTAWPYLIIASTASVTGTVGNLLILGSVYSYKKLRKSRNAFLVNMALADLCVTLFADPLGIIGKYTSKCC